METRAHHVLIGFFTLAVAAASLLFGLWLAKSGNERDVRYYDIIFSEAVSGLTLGSAVEYNGIRVGDVTTLSLDPADPRRVLARVRLVAGTPVRTDTRARLALANITGAANIQLSGGTPDSPPLQGEGNALPLILAEPSPLARLRVNSEELLVGTMALLENAKLLLTKENAHHVGRILANLDSTSSMLAGEQEAIRQGIRDLALASRELKQSLAQASRLLGQLDKAFDGKSERLLTNADKTLAALERLSRNLDSLLADNQQAMGSGLQGLAELGPTIVELRSTLATLGKIARRLGEDPSALLLEREPMKEFQP